MSDLGFNYPVTPYQASNVGVMSQLYPTAEELAQYGYSWRNADPANQPKDPPSSANSDPQFNAALDGTGSSPGCGKKAFDALQQEQFSLAQQVLFNANIQILDGVQADGKYQSVLSSWHECIMSAGYSYADPSAAGKEADLQGMESPQSLVIARADYACRHTVQLEEVVLQLSEDYTERWIEAHPEQIRDFQNAKEQLVRRAKDVVGA